MTKDLSNWDWYRTFLAVLEEGSLSAAARSLGLTQPTAGRHVEALERHLGLPLFTRSQQGLMPTEAARRLQPQAKLMATTAASLLRMASGERDGVSGTVRISASDVVGVEVLPPILAALQADHPELTIELSLSDKIEDLLRREADIAVRMTAPKQEVLLVRTVGPVSLGMYARRDYLERCGMPESLGDLKRHRLIGFDRETAFIRAAMEALPLLSGFTFSFRADNNLAQLAAIRAGLGIGLCQVPLARRQPDLVRLFADDIELLLETHVVMHEDMKSARRCRVVFDALVQGLKAFTGA